MARLSLETCMDMVDGEERVKRALPALRKHARWLLNLHSGTEHAYPEQFLNQPA